MIAQTLAMRYFGKEKWKKSIIFGIVAALLGLVAILTIPGVPFLMAIVSGALAVIWYKKSNNDGIKIAVAAGVIMLVIDAILLGAVIAILVGLGISEGNISLMVVGQ